MPACAPSSHALGMNLLPWRRQTSTIERLERRASQRSLAGFRARVVALNGAPQLKPGPAVVHNISLGGLAMLSDLHLQPEDKVGLSFVFPGDELPTHVDVGVIETKRLVTREYLAHCAFLSLPSDVSEKVADWTAARGPA